MKPYLLFAILSFIVTLRSCQSSCEEQEPQESLQEERLNVDNFPRDFLKRYNDIDYDTFVGLMGRRSAGMNNLPPLKRDMDDIFVGLMGRRSSESNGLYRVCTPPCGHSERSSQTQFSSCDSCSFGDVMLGRGTQPWSCRDSCYTGAACNHGGRRAIRREEEPFFSTRVN